MTKAEKKVALADSRVESSKRARPVEESLDHRRLRLDLGQRRARAQEPAIAHHLRLDLAAQATVHRVEAGLGGLEAVEVARRRQLPVRPAPRPCR